MEASVGNPVIGANSVAFKVGDPVYIDSSGFLALQTTSSKVIGYITEDITMASDNQTVAKVCPQYVYAEGVEMYVDADAALAQADVGHYTVLSSATGNAQTVDADTSATVGQYLILGWDTDTPDTAVAVVVASFLQKECYASS